MRSRRLGGKKEEAKEFHHRRHRHRRPISSCRTNSSATPEGRGRTRHYCAWAPALTMIPGNSVSRFQRAKQGRIQWLLSDRQDCVRYGHAPQRQDGPLSLYCDRGSHGGSNHQRLDCSEGPPSAWQYGMCDQERHRARRHCNRSHDEIPSHVTRGEATFETAQRMTPPPYASNLAKTFFPRIPVE